MEERRTLAFDSPIGTLVAEASGDALTALHIVPCPDSRRADPMPGRQSAASHEAIRKTTQDECADDLLRDCRRQLEAYFAGRRHAFDLPMRPRGSAWQQAVWRELQTIAYGQTLTYGALAAQLGRPTAARAVARAVASNPLPILIPCHRVVASHGLGGYSAGDGLPTKRHLLSLEASNR